MLKGAAKIGGVVGHAQKLHIFDVNKCRGWFHNGPTPSRYYLQLPRRLLRLTLLLLLLMQIETDMEIHS